MSPFTEPSKKATTRCLGVNRAAPPSAMMAKAMSASDISTKAPMIVGLAFFTLLIAVVSSRHFTIQERLHKGILTVF